MALSKGANTMGPLSSTYDSIANEGARIPCVGDGIRILGAWTPCLGCAVVALAGSFRLGGTFKLQAWTVGEQNDRRVKA